MSILDLKSAKFLSFRFQKKAEPEEKQALFKVKLILAFVAIYFVWGSTFLAIRFAIETIPPFFMMGFRLFLAGGILYTWARLRGSKPPQPAQWLTALALGFLFFMAGHGALVWSEQFVPSGVAALICATSPVWIIFLQAFRHAENPLTARVILGLVFGLCGVAVLMEPSMILGGTTAHLKGALVLLVGTISWSIGVVFSKRANLPENALLAAGMNLLTGGTGLLFLSYLNRETVDILSVSFLSLLSLTYLILFGSILTFSAYFWLLRTVSPSQVATHSFVNPVIAVLVGWLVGGELLNPRMLMASFLMVIGVWAIVRQKPATRLPLENKRHNNSNSVINIFSGKRVRQKEVL